MKRKEILEELKWMLPTEEIERIKNAKTVIYSKEMILKFIDQSIELTKQSIELIKNEKADFAFELYEKLKLAEIRENKVKQAVEELDQYNFTFYY